MYNSTVLDLKHILLQRDAIRCSESDVRDPDEVVTQQHWSHVHYFSTVLYCTVLYCITIYPLIHV